MPLALIVVGSVEALGGSVILVKALAHGLALARAAHPIGMTKPAPNPFRAIGVMLTMLVLGIVRAPLLRLVIGA